MDGCSSYFFLGIPRQSYFVFVQLAGDSGTSLDPRFRADSSGDGAIPRREIQMGDPFRRRMTPDGGRENERELPSSQREEGATPTFLNAAPPSPNPASVIITWE